MALWMVRAERGSILFDDFIARGMVAIGWSQMGDLQHYATFDSIKGRVGEIWPDANSYVVGRTAGMLWRLFHEIKSGDLVITYDQGSRKYEVGKVVGNYEFLPEAEAVTTGDESYPHIRRVEWKVEISRDDLSVATRNSLGSLFTLFLLPQNAEDEINAIISGEPKPQQVEQDDAALEVEVSTQVENIEGRSIEFIKDMLARISPNDMELFVAGLLRGLGYKTQVSPIGPDRGQDILASPDYLGLEDPRVVVEVKHRRESIGAPAIRSFLGGRHPQDRGLYVSTGGFTKEARYEADRANIPLRLMTSDDLVRILVEHYDALDMETRAMVPLKKIYWPLN